MAKTYHVYSKMTGGVRYNDYIRTSETTSKIKSSVLIKGGAGVANKNIITPLGVHTEITAEEREMLLNNGIFKKHMEAGFVTIEERKEDPDKVATNLTEGPDPSAPLTPADYETQDGGKVAVPESVKKGAKK